MSEGANNASVVARVEYGNVDLLFPGDVEAATERDLVRTYEGNLEADIVKVPHHGSETSSTPDFVESVTEPDRTHAVVSVGKASQYGMPDEKVLRRWKHQAKEIHSTADRGSVWMRTDGQTVWRANRK